MPRLLINGVNISCQQFGDGPDLVFIHGLAASRAFWYAPIALALQRRYRVTLYDLRGHGYSDMPASHYRPADMAQDLAGLLDALGIARALLVGHSFGGAVALHYALESPQRVSGLVLADTRLNSLQPHQRLADSPHMTPFERSFIERSEVDWDAEDDMGLRFLEEVAKARWTRSESGRSRDFVPFARAGARDRAARRWLQLLSTTTAREDLHAPLAIGADAIAALRPPLLLVYGTRSRCLPTCRALRRLLPMCETVIVPRAGHFHPRTRPRIFLGALSRFAKTCVAADAPRPTAQASGLRAIGGRP